MLKLKPWVIGIYELLRHAEMHRNEGGDFDRRVSMVNYDNAIELSISTYLKLDPKQRSGRQFRKEDVAKWLDNYHSKLDFVEHYVTNVLKQAMPFEKDEVIYYHNIRNDLYHANGVLVPRVEDVVAIRAIAHGIFNLLYEMHVTQLLEAELTGSPLDVPTRNEISPENQVFGALVEIRKDIGQLRHELIPAAQTVATDEQIVNTVLGNESSDSRGRLQGAFERANQVAISIKEDRPIAASPVELDELIFLLKSLKQRLDVPLRAYQRELAQRALEATIRAFSERRRIIGHILQSTGTGLASTAVAYLGLIAEHPRFYGAPLVVVSDVNVIVDQLYQRIAGAFRSGRRRVYRLTSQTEGAGLVRDPACIIVTSAAVLRGYARQIEFPPDLLTVAFGIDLVEGSATTALLEQRFVISFTSRAQTMLRGQGELIGQYSFQQAQRDGFLVPLVFEDRALPVLGQGATASAELDSPKNEFLESIHPGGSRWTEAGLKRVAADIADHFISNRDDSTSKGLVLVHSTADAVRLGGALCQELLESGKAPNASVAVISSGLERHELEKALEALASPQSELSLLVCGRMWTGIDLGSASSAYVTCRLTADDFWLLAGNLASPRSGKRSAVLVDYARNFPAKGALAP